MKLLTLSLCLLLSACTSSSEGKHYRTPREEMLRIPRAEPIECARLDAARDVCSDGKSNVYECTTTPGQHSICTIYDDYRL